MPVPHSRVFPVFAALTFLACTAAAQGSASTTTGAPGASAAGQQVQDAQKRPGADQQPERPTSATTDAAPEPARAAFEAGYSAENEGNLPYAQQKFEEATRAYPAFAEAWEQLGVVLQRENQIDDAQKAFQQAVTADAKFAPPYFGLAGIATQRRQWADAVHLSQQTIDLDPVNFTGAYLINSISNFNLGKFDPAEASARQAEKLDSDHRLPMIESVLGRILLVKKDYRGAADSFKAYLQLAPNAPDAVDVRRQLTALQQAAATPAPKPADTPKQ